MPLLQIKNLEKSFRSVPLFEPLSFNVDEGEHIALIGANGSGKSTLLKMIAGKWSPDAGRIDRAQGLIISYFSQNEEEMTSDGDETALFNPSLLALKTRLRAIEKEMGDIGEDPERLRELLTLYDQTQTDFELAGGYNYEAELSRILAHLGFDMNLLDRKLRTLSGGERTRVRLAKLLLEKSDLMLLDEPSNHLDIEGLEWLSSYLAQSKKAIITVSHDRSLLDRVSQKVLELEGGKLFAYRGNYRSSREQRKARLDLLAQSEKNLTEKIAREEEITQTLRSHRKIASFHARQKVVFKLKEQLQALRGEAKYRDKSLRFGIVELPELKHDQERLLLDFKDLSLSYDKPLFEGFSDHLKADERLAVLGPNGCGKSSLLKLFMGETLPDSGRLRLNSAMEIAYMGQYVDLGDETRNVYEYLEEESSEKAESRLRARLAQFGFRENDLIKKISVLSGGERHRLYLCRLLELRPDLIILDEPTNHLDIVSRELLEEALLAYPGAILMVSHDRYLIERLAKEVWGFVNGKIDRYPDYNTWFTAYRASLDPFSAISQNETKELRTERAPKVSITEKGETSPPAGTHTTEDSAPNEQEKKSAAFRKLPASERRKRLAQLRREIAELEKRIHEIEEAQIKFNDPAALALHTAEDYARYAEESAALENAYMEYFEKSERLSAFSTD